MRIALAGLAALAVTGSLWAQEPDAGETYGIYRPPPPPAAGTPPSDSSPRSDSPPAAPASGVAPAPRETGAAPARTGRASSVTIVTPSAYTAAAAGDSGVRPPQAPAAGPAKSLKIPAERADSTAADPSGPAVAGEDTSLTARMDATRGGGLQRAEFPDLGESAALARHYTVFLELMGRSGRAGALRDSLPLTVLAPTDSAFELLPADALAALRSDSATLERWAASVLLNGDRTLAELLRVRTVRSRAGTEIRFTRGPDGLPRAGTARVIQPDVAARRGRLHGVDRVTIPAAGLVPAPAEGLGAATSAAP